MDTKPLVSERLESPAQQQSQEVYLLPRNCWFHISGIQFRTTTLDRIGQKVRLKISVPNSARVIRTSYVVIDQQTQSRFKADEDGFCEFPVDITVLCEYKHDIRINRQSNLEFDFETGARYKTFGYGVVDLAEIIQCPQKMLLKMKKDNGITGKLRISVYSLCISETAPDTRNIKETDSYRIVSDREDEPTPYELTQEVQAQLKRILEGTRMVLLDDSSREGNVFREASFNEDYVLPVSDVDMIPCIFEMASQNAAAYSNDQFRLVVAGDLYFFAAVVSGFLSKRDSGQLLSDAFLFQFLPLFKGSLRFKEEFGHEHLIYQTHVPGTEWFSLLGEQSKEQNIASYVSDELERITTSSVKKRDLQIAEVILTTSSKDQKIVPMVVDLNIGEYVRCAHKVMKATFCGEGSKTFSIRFHHLAMTLVGTHLSTVWRTVSNTNELSENLSIDKYRSERKSRESSKVILSVKKGQAPVHVFVDNKEYRDVVSITVTIKDPTLAVHLGCTCEVEMRSKDI